MIPGAKTLLQLTLLAALVRAPPASEPNPLDGVGMIPDPNFSLTIEGLPLQLPGRNDVYFNILNGMERLARGPYDSPFSSTAFHNPKYPAVKVVCINVDGQRPLLNKIVLWALYQTYLDLSFLAAGSEVWSSAKTYIRHRPEMELVGACLVVPRDYNYPEEASLSHESTFDRLGASSINSNVTTLRPRSLVKDTVVVSPYSLSDQPSLSSNNARCYISVRFVRPRVEIGIDNIFPFILETIIEGAQHTEGEAIGGIQLLDYRFHTSLDLRGIEPSPAEPMLILNKGYVLTAMRTLAREIVDRGRFDNFDLTVYALNSAGSAINIATGEIRRI